MILTERFHYLGGNLRLDGRAVELRFALDDADAVTAFGPDHGARLARRLADLEVPAAAFSNGAQAAGATGAGEALAWLMQSLLEHAQHPVASTAVSLDRAGRRLCVVVAADDVDTDLHASGLAMGLLDATLPGAVSIDPEFADYIIAPSPPAFEAFLGQGRARAMCAETLAIVAAARRLGVPVVSLDRDPYPGSTGQLRMRKNGILMLGQCQHRRILDGTVYIDADPTAVRLTHEPRLRGRLLSRLQVPLAARPALEQRHRAFLTIGGQHVASFVRSGNGWAPEGGPPHPELAQLAERIAGWAKAAAVLVEVDGTGLADRPGSAGGARAIVDFSVAPRLDTLLQGEPERLARASEALVRWAFPGAATGRVPTVGVTGTCGKSTTSLMIHSILASDGREPGVAWTGGVMLGSEQVEDGDLAGFAGHLRLFESAAIDSAVLETARGGIVTAGFAYDHCDVAVCTNVAEDHIGLDGIDTVDEMARVKALVVQRARHAAVLNADDAYCGLMLACARAEHLGVVSSRLSLDELRQQFGQARVYCAVAGAPEQQLIELHDGAERVCAVPVNEIPVTLGGRARFNVENAMQALVASHFMGASPAAMMRGLTGFRSRQGAYVGRLNLYAGQRFTVIMDMAHNVPSLQRLAEFADSMPCSGRRIALLGVPPDRTEQQARDMSRVVHGHYDEFVIRPSGPKPGIPEGAMHLAEACYRELQSLGVPQECLHLRSDLMEAVDFALNRSGRGDLLVIHMTIRKLVQTWQRIVDFAPNPPA